MKTKPQRTPRAQSFGEKTNRQDAKDAKKEFDNGFAHAVLFFVVASAMSWIQLLGPKTWRSWRLGGFQVDFILLSEFSVSSVANVIR